MQLGGCINLNQGSLLLSYYYLSTWIVYTNFVLGVSQLITKCLIECLITYFYYLTDDVVVSLFCHLPNVYRELLEPFSINRVLILNFPFNSYKPGPSTISSLIQSLLFLLISIIILII